MDKKSGIGRYFLVFEPKYVYHQYAVYFTPDGTAQVTEISKYSDRANDSKKTKIKKNLLSDIDKVTARLSDLGSFFKTYIDKEIFRYYTNNLHKMFIGYKHNERIYKLNYVLNSPLLLEKTLLVCGSRIDDLEGINSIIKLILESENNGFLRFIVKEKREGNTSLSNCVINLSASLRMSNNMDNFSEKNELKSELEKELTSYKEYREIFLLKIHYEDYLQEEKERLNKLREEANKISTFTIERPQLTVNVPLQEYEQLSFFNDDSKGFVKAKRFGTND